MSLLETAANGALPEEREILAALGERDGLDLLCYAHGIFGRRMALVSSFGIESAVLLDMVARIDPGLAVIFIDTGRPFAETPAYRDRLVGLLGLRDVRTVHPDPARLVRLDPEGSLHLLDRDSAVRSARASRSTGRSRASTPGSPGASATRSVCGRGLCGSSAIPCDRPSSSTRSRTGPRATCCDTWRRADCRPIP